MDFLFCRSSKNTTRNSNWWSYYRRSQQINFDMFCRRKPITKIPMATEVAQSAGNIPFNFVGIRRLFCKCSNKHTRMFRYVISSDISTFHKLLPFEVLLPQILKIGQYVFFKYYDLNIILRLDMGPLVTYANLDYIILHVFIACLSGKWDNYTKRDGKV